MSSVAQLLVGLIAMLVATLGLWGLAWWLWPRTRRSSGGHGRRREPAQRRPAPPPVASPTEATQILAIAELAPVLARWSAIQDGVAALRRQRAREDTVVNRTRTLELRRPPPLAAPRARIGRGQEGSRTG